MKQLIVGFIAGAVITGTGALAATNPLSGLPLQTQVDKLVEACTHSFEAIDEGFINVLAALEALNERLTLVENRLNKDE